MSCLYSYFLERQTNNKCSNKHCKCPREVGPSNLNMYRLVGRFSSIEGPTLISDVNRKVKDLVFKGLNDQALKLYKNQLHLHGRTTSSSVLPSVIKACSQSQTHRLLGLQLHCYILETGSDSESVVSNSLISMYAKFSDTICARNVFDTMPQKDTISWNSMINCFIHNGYGIQSIDMFKEMYKLGFVPKSELIASILSVCVQTGCFRLGIDIHALITVDERIEESVFLSTALLDLYWRCQDAMTAFSVFNRMEVKNEVSWTAMISGCVADHNYDMALDFFKAMQVEGIKPNRVTLIAILPACAKVDCSKHGKEINGYAFRHGYDSDIRFSSALMHMYSKGGESLHTAKLIFELSTNKDVVMWSSIIASCSQSGDSAEESIRLFHQMRKEEIPPNFVTLLAVISACTNLSSISYGRGVHGYVLKCGLDSELSIGNSLINMYSKCGSLSDSHQTFMELSTRDSISWGALINAYALHGCGEEALELFCEMQKRGIEADAITYLAILSAFNHAGLVEEGHTLFENALKANRISLTIEHYACHVDLLGRAGKLEDACALVMAMPMKPSTKIWSSLVSSCKLHGRLEVAEMLAHQLIMSEPKNAALHTLLSMVYAESGNWPGVEEVRREMRVRGLKKSCGFSRIEVENELL